MNYDYAFLLTSLLLFFGWVIFYYFNPHSRKKILLVSLLTAPVGLAEPLFVPSYWLPFTVFDLARQTRFDLESILFSFAVGGITAILYESVWGKSRKPVSLHEIHQGRHRFHRLAVFSPIVLFGLLYLFTPLNPIYSTIISLMIGAIITWFCRPDLLNAMITGSVLFVILYSVVFLIGFVWLFPGYVEAVWNLPSLSGILIAGVPIEELLFAFSLGAMWSSIYEHFNWYTYSS